MDRTKAFAILVPVPEIHLVSGQETCESQGKVAFGSMAFEIFRKADEMRADLPVDIFIYAADATNRAFNSEVTWRGLYIGHVQSRSGRYPSGAKFRPASTASDKPTWAIFFEVQELEQLTSPMAIASLKELNKNANLKPRFIPDSPLLIAHPG